ncbi:hypothetical protein IQ272_24890 [Chroococcidiopsidales cyanobacterium LEGE 13417]|nr:hypothetical protein [Chroococcidiopsidales cyanobacterium LEGE 13417]
MNSDRYLSVAIAVKPYDSVSLDNRSTSLLPPFLRGVGGIFQGTVSVK